MSFRSRWPIFMLSVVMACSHTLKIDSDPVGADIYVGTDPQTPGRLVGKTPAALNFTEVFPAGSGFVTLQKQGFNRVSTLISEASFGGFSQTLKVKLIEGIAGGSLATQLMQHVRNAQRLSAALQFDQAHIEIDKALEADPAFAFALSFKAGLYFVEKKYEESERLYRRVLEVDPRYDEATRMLAKIAAVRSPASSAETSSSPPGGGSGP